MPEKVSAIFAVKDEMESEFRFAHSITEEAERSGAGSAKLTPPIVHIHRSPYVQTGGPARSEVAHQDLRVFPQRCRYLMMSGPAAWCVCGSLAPAAAAAAFPVHSAPADAKVGRSPCRVIRGILVRIWFTLAQSVEHGFSAETVFYGRFSNKMRSLVCTSYLLKT